MDCPATLAGARFDGAGWRAAQSNATTRGGDDTFIVRRTYGALRDYWAMELRDQAEQERIKACRPEGTYVGGPWPFALWLGLHLAKFLADFRLPGARLNDPSWPKVPLVRMLHWAIRGK